MNNGYYPYSVDKDPAINFNMDVKGQMLKYKEDEAHQKASEILPFEFDNIIKVLGDAFVSLTELRKMLGAAKQNKLVNQKAIEDIQNKIDKINQMMLEIPDDLSIISL